MLFTEFAAGIEAGDIKPIYFFAGSESFLHYRARELLKSAIISPGSEGFDLDVMEGSEYQFDKLRAALRSLPMMSKQRLLILKRFDEIDSRHYGKILDVLKEDLSRMVVALCYEKRPLFRPKSSLMEFRKRFSWVDVSTPRSHEFTKILNSMVPEMEIADNLASFLAESGVDLWQISIWFEQASNLSGNGGKLTLETMQEFIDLGGTADIWRLIDKVGERDLKKAQILLQDLLRNREKPGAILWPLKDLFLHLNLMCKIRVRGANPENYREKLKDEMHAFRFNKFSQQSRRFTVGEVENALLRIQETDLKLKTSQGDPNSLLIELLDGIIGE